MKEIDELTEVQREKLVKRFMSKVKKGRGGDDCWIWTGAISRGGYGNINISMGKYAVAHRVVYTLLVGTIPEGKFVLHSCDVRNCVNPEHLRIGTTADNMQDRILRSPKGINKKLSPPEVVAIRRARKQSIPCAELAKKYNVHVETISKAATGKNWGCVPEHLVAPTHHPAISSSQVVRIRELRRLGHTYSRIANDCGVSPYTVGRIIRGERHQNE